MSPIPKRLYVPDSPARIPGRAYEKFLSREARKAGGVYYTPACIIDYIVKQTVGKLLEASPGKPLKILDPACGSGFFLIRAYQFLLDRHLNQYISGDPKKQAKGKKPALYQTDSGGWRLTADERRRILLNSIFGVDIDPKAVELTKVSLLKLLEGEDRQCTGKNRVLSDLANNIKCGNSLIGPDFYENQQMSLDEDEIYRINVFDWHAEFPEIMGNGGFDAVIGNPPYVRQETLGHAKLYFQKHFSVYQGTADLYVYFIEKSLSLLRPDGFFGFIVSNKWMRANYGKPLRQWMKQQHISEIADFGDLPVFEQAAAYPCILLIKKASPKKVFKAVQIKDLKFSDLAGCVSQNSFDVEQKLLEDSGWSLGNRDMQNLLNKLRSSGVPLGQYVNAKIYSGIKTGLNQAFVIDEAIRNRLICQDAKSEEIIKPFLLGKEIKRYQPPLSSHYLIFMPKGWTNRQTEEKNAWKWLNTNYPAIGSYLNQFSESAQKRCDKGDYWWELRACDYYNAFETPKIMLPDISIRSNFTFDSEGKHYCVNAAYIISNAEKYVLGILNSALINFFYKNISSAYRGGYLRFIYQYLVTIPVRTVDFGNSLDNSLHEQMVSLVEQMLSLNKQFSKAVFPQEKTVLSRRIEATDRQIDQLVYQLYDLTEEEIKIAEGGS